MYDASVNAQKLGIEPSQDGGDLSTIYNDMGFIFQHYR